MVTTLYRPVGLNEMGLLYDDGCRAFPPRFEHQPIFYPVTSAEYATQIAGEWNTRDLTSGFCGYVTSFDVAQSFLSGYDCHTVGSAKHEEYWIPAADLPGFNHAVVGLIRMEAAFFGFDFRGFVPERGNFKGKTAEEQFAILAANHDYSRMDFVLEIAVNAKAVYLHYLFWIQHNFTACGVTPHRKLLVLEDIRTVWQSKFIQPPLPTGL